MKKNLLRITAVVLLLVMAVSLSACGQKEMLVRFVDSEGNDLDLQGIFGNLGNGGGSNAGANTGTNTGTNPGTNTTPAPSGDTAATTAAPAPSGDTTATTAAPAPSGDTTATTAAPAPSGDDTATTAAPAPTSDLPQDPAGILALYAEVVNGFKSTKPAATKIQYQELPSEYRNLGAAANAVLDLASGMMTSKADAEANPGIYEAGDSMNYAPVYHTDYGCLLTDPSWIQSASCVDNGDGTATITITVKDEQDVQPVPSGATSASSGVPGMFAPMSMEDIMAKIEEVKVVKVNTFSLNYTGCTAVITFEKESKHLILWTEHMNVDITADAKVTIFPLKGGARLTDDVIIKDIRY